MSEGTTFSNVGLYSGNVIIEYNTDQKVVKPVIKVNEKATIQEVDKAIELAIHALIHSTAALDAYDFTVPEPTKAAIVTENDREGKRYDGGIYGDNKEILSAKDGEVEHHSQ